MKILRCWCSNPTGENFLLLIYSSLQSNTKLTTLTTLCITGKLDCTDSESMQKCSTGTDSYGGSNANHGHSLVYSKN